MTGHCRTCDFEWDVEKNELDDRCPDCGSEDINLTEDDDLEDGGDDGDKDEEE